MSEKAISAAARDVLSRTRIDGTHVYLPQGQLARSLYQEVNEVLERLGGKWKGGRVKAHIFESDPTDDVQTVVQTGLMPPKNATAHFPTPPEVIQFMLYDSLFYQLDLAPRESISLLEPSAGKGAIAHALRAYMIEHQPPSTAIRIDCCEIVPAYAAFLRSEGFAVVAEDFLSYHPTDLYDAVVMNPPFTIGSDTLTYLMHLLHAWELLRSGGVLVAIVPSGFAFNATKKLVAFREEMSECGAWRDLPSGSFRESDTMVNTILLTAVKPPTTEKVPVVAVAPKVRAASQDRLFAESETLWNA